MKNRLIDILGISYPIILGPMRMITLGAMAAAVSKSGGLGQIASSGLTFEHLREEILKARELTAKPVAVNIPLHRGNAVEILQIAAEAGIKVVTTSGGNPAKIMNEAKTAGIRILHKVSTVEMGLKAQDAGVSAVIGMGFEAGGHAGTSQITTFCLIPRLADALHIPVIAAGGISDYRGFLAALALGAEGVEIGTRFLTAQECPIPEYYKGAVRAASDTGTLVVGDGAMKLRILRNKAAESLVNPQRNENDGVRVMDYSKDRADRENTIMPAGQGAGLIHDVQPIEEIIAEFVNRSQELLMRIKDSLM